MAISTDWTFALLIVAAVIVVVVGFELLQRLRHRRSQLVADLSSSPVFADDRAHNRIRIARSELTVLQREGTDVPRAAELLDEAEAALQHRQNVEAVRLAQQAHGMLVDARQSGMAASAAPAISLPPARAAPPPAGGARAGPAATGRFPPGGATADPAPVAGTASDDPAKPPKNRMEAHFQMTLLVEQLQTGRELRPTPPGWSEAEQLRNGAQAAYARADYTEALRLALRGRRRLGAPIETLAPPPRAGASPSASGDRIPPAPGPGGGTRGRCARCGRPTPSEDRFCRGCGASLRASTCPRCQGTIGPEDTFCGLCGSPLA